MVVFVMFQSASLVLARSLSRIKSDSFEYGIITQYFNGRIE